MAEPNRTRRAYAKVNLALAVDPPIAAGLPNAGYHPICSWMHAIDLWDEVSARPPSAGESSPVSIEWATDAPRPTPIDWPADKDLAARAHRALEAELGRVLPVEITVKKRIPVGAGLGGGSSDAAATLLLLDELFGLRLGTERLAAVGHRLGSDVPFFVDPYGPARPAIVSGLGERVQRTTRASADLDLVIPPFGCPTRGVYGAFDRLIAQPAGRIVGVDAGARRLTGAAVRGALEKSSLFNDLAGAAELAEPRLAGVRERAETASGLEVHLTGSGSVMFVVGADGDIRARLRQALPECTIVRSRLV